MGGACTEPKVAATGSHERGCTATGMLMVNEKGGQGGHIRKMEHYFKFIFPVCEIIIKDTMSSFIIKKNCQNINGIKVTKYVQLVISECKGETVPEKQNIIYKFVQSQRIQTKRREGLMHVIRKQVGKNECNGKSLLSLSIQSYAVQTHQTKGTIFSD